MDVDRAQANLTVRDRDGHSSGVSRSNISLGDVGSSLLTSGVVHLDLVDDACNVGKVRFLSSAGVGSCRCRSAGGSGRSTVGHVVAIHGEDNRRDKKSNAAQTEEGNATFSSTGAPRWRRFARSSGRLLDGRTLFSSHHSAVSLQTFIVVGTHDDR